jgi:hypothetical protein
MSVSISPQELPDATRGTDFSFSITAIVDQPEDGPAPNVDILKVDVEIKGGLDDSDFDIDDIFEFSGTKLEFVENTTFDNIIPKNEDGNDTSGLVDIKLTSSGIVYTNNTVSILVHIPGSEYVKDNILTILGTDLGGLSPDNDLTIKIKKVFSDYQVVSGTNSASLSGTYSAGFTDNFSYVKKGSSDLQETPIIAVGVENVPKVKEMFKLTNQDLKNSIDRQFKVTVEYRELESGSYKYKSKTFIVSQKINNTLEAIRKFISDYFPKD